MKRLWARMHSTSVPALVVISIMFLGGTTMWALGPAEGDKYSDLGINLAVGAALGLAILYVETLFQRGESRREQRLAEEQRFIQGLLAAPDLTDIQIPGRSLAGTILSDRSLKGANLRRTGLDRIDLRRTNLTGADLSGSIGKGVNLHGATVDAMRARDVVWSETSLARIVGSDVDFTDSVITDSSMADMRLPRALVDRARWLGADLRRSDLSGCHGTGLTLTGADLRAASLRGARLSGADLREVDLRAGDLREATLDDPDLRGADLRDCQAEGLIIRNPISDDRTRLPAGFSETQL
jgi:uncharacterized protein YjbI with pentapeptide repeats